MRRKRFAFEITYLNPIATPAPVNYLFLASQVP